MSKTDESIEVDEPGKSHPSDGSGESPYPLSTLRHSTAHVMASAVKELFPDAQLGIGPAIEDGFYYDFLTERPFTPEDLKRIEKRMQEIVRRKTPFERDEMSKETAKRLFEEKGETLKVELIDDTPEEEVFSTYRHETRVGPFIDWCRGPHVPNTGECRVFRLTRLAAAYWRGDESRPQLQRIYGTAFFTQEEMEEHLRRMEEAEKRDHRRLGRELGLFLISSEVGAGLPLWLPKGAMLRRTLEEYIRAELLKRGYEPVATPHIARTDLFRTSGHMTAYAESMYPVMKHENGEEFVLKPVNCPFHIQIYRSQPRSYRDLPLRFAEFGTVYRWEQSGEVGGLTRVRGFTQDDAHLFLAPEQLPEEFKRNVELVLLVLRRLNLSYTARVGFRDPEKPDKYVGDLDAWEQSQSALLGAVRDLGLEHTVEVGEAAIYGPKLDFMVKDAIGRQWQLGTVQVDYVLPERFGLEYTGADGQAHRPVMIHRAPFGSFERFIGVLIEHFAGAFPLWLAPVQARLLPIADRHNEYAEEVRCRLDAAELRADVDLRTERTGYKIREAQLQKIPYMLVVGDREVEEGAVSVRSRDRGDLGSRPVAEMIAEMTAEGDA